MVGSLVLSRVASICCFKVIVSLFFFYYCGDRERRKILLNMLLCPTLPYIRTVSLCPLLLVSLPLSSSSRESGLELSREGNILNITEHIAIQKDYVKWNMGINDISRILLVY